MASAHSAEPTRHRLRWLIGLAVFVALLGAVEWWARGTNPQLPSWNDPEEEGLGLMTGHPTRLWGMLLGERSNGETTAFINMHGIRGEVPEVPRPEGRQRILTLGDSGFFGSQVSDEEVFTARLQTYLREQGVDVDVVNGGVAEYSIAQHKLFMEEVGWALQPTLIVYCNLWSDNSWDTFRDEDLLASRRFAQLSPLVHSATTRLLAAKLSRPENDRGGRVIVWREDQGWPERMGRRVPLPRFVALHDEVVREAASRGIGGAFMIPTNSALLSAIEPPLSPYSWAPYFDAFRRLAVHHSMPIIDLTNVLSQGLEEDLRMEDLLLDLMHPSPESHRRIAESLGAALLEAGWPDDALVGASAPVDGSSLEDLPNIHWLDDIGAGSPQRQLFEISEEEQVAIAKRAADRAVAGPVSKKVHAGPNLEGKAEVPVLAGDAEGASGGPAQIPPPTSAWEVQIIVKGGTPPYKVVVRDADGRPTSSARLLKPTTIRLKLHGSLNVVQVEVTDGEGEVGTASVPRSAPHASINLPGR